MGGEVPGFAQFTFAVLEQRPEEIAPRLADIIIGLYEDWPWLLSPCCAISNVSRTSQLRIANEYGQRQTNQN